MKLIINNKTIDIDILTKFFPRLKGYMMRLMPITDGLCYPKKRSYHTYFFCQQVDIVMTDKNYKVLHIYHHLRSEKIIFFKRKVYYTFILPVGSADTLKKEDTLIVKEDSTK